MWDCGVMEVPHLQLAWPHPSEDVVPLARWARGGGLAAIATGPEIGALLPDGATDVSAADVQLFMGRMPGDHRPFAAGLARCRSGAGDAVTWMTAEADATAGAAPRQGWRDPVFGTLAWDGPAVHGHARCDRDLLAALGRPELRPALHLEARAVVPVVRWAGRRVEVRWRRAVHDHAVLDAMVAVLGVACARFA